MNSRRLAMSVVCTLMLITLLVVVIYFVLDYTAVADTTYAGTIEYVNDAAAPPVSYKNNFAKWTYVMADDGTEYTTLQVIQPQVQIGSLGIILTDGSQGHHASDIGSFAGSAGTDTQTEIMYYYNAIISTGSELSPLNELNPSNLAIGLYANLSSEGKPMMWEVKPDKWNKTGYKDKPLANGDVVRQVSNGTTYVDIATKKSGDNHFYVSSGEQLINLYNLGEGHIVFESHLGIGSVQWSGERCWKFIAHAYKTYNNKTWTFSDLSSLKKMETDYLLTDLNWFMSEYLRPDNYYDVSVEQCAGFIAAKYECPYNSAAYHHWKKELTNKYYKGSTGETFVLTDSNDFFDGTVSDFSEPYYWEGTKTEVSESSRIRKAIKMFEEMMGGTGA